MKLIVLLFSLLTFSTFGWAQIPKQISYQGVLTDSLGMAKPDGSYAFIFQLYGVPNGGTVLWKESKSLTIKKGFFATMLGDRVPLPDSLAFDRPYWLSVELAGEVLSPRLPLTAVAYSLGAARASHSDTARYAISTGSVTSGGDLSIGSSTASGVLTENYNDIPSTRATSAINASPGLLLINNNASSADRAENSPSVQLRHSSWNPDAGASQENSWYIQNWGFTTPGLAGGVFSLINKHQLADGTFRTCVPFVIDEIGRTLIGYSEPHEKNYYGFWGEDFGEWGVILSGRTVVGWPEGSVRRDFRVTGSTTLDANLNVGNNTTIGGSLTANDARIKGNVSATTFQTEGGQRFKVLSGSDSVSVSNLPPSTGLTSEKKSFGYLFNNAPVVVITNTSSPESGMDQVVIGVTAKTTTGFTLRVNNLLSTAKSSGTVHFDWIAIGE